MGVICEGFRSKRRRRKREKKKGNKNISMLEAGFELYYRSIFFKTMRSGRNQGSPAQKNREVEGEASVRAVPPEFEICTTSAPFLNMFVIRSFITLCSSFFRVNQLMFMIPISVCVHISFIGEHGVSLLIWCNVSLYNTM
jgi:hypothetical protein